MCYLLTSVSKKKWTNYSTVSLLWFVQFFLKQTLYGTVQEETDTERLFTIFQRFCETSKQYSLEPT